MKLCESCGRYRIDPEKLSRYARLGLLDPDEPCSAECLEQFCLINCLFEAGVEPRRIKLILESGSGERLRLLRLERCRLLEELHSAQSSLDSLDYLIHGLSDPKKRRAPDGTP